MKNSILKIAILALTIGIMPIGTLNAMNILRAAQSAKKSGLLGSSLKGAAVGTLAGYCFAHHLNECRGDGKYGQAAATIIAAPIAPYLLEKHAQENQKGAKDMKLQRNAIVAKDAFNDLSIIDKHILSEKSIKQMSQAAYRAKCFSRAFTCASLMTAAIAGYRFLENRLAFRESLTQSFAPQSNNDNDN